MHSQRNDNRQLKRTSKDCVIELKQQKDRERGERRQDQQAAPHPGSAEHGQDRAHGDSAEHAQSYQHRPEMLVERLCPFGLDLFYESVSVFQFTVNVRSRNATLYGSSVIAVYSLMPIFLHKFIAIATFSQSACLSARITTVWVSGLLV